jgi:hypothetical protein
VAEWARRAGRRRGPRRAGAARWAGGASLLGRARGALDDALEPRDERGGESELGVNVARYEDGERCRGARVRKPALGNARRAVEREVGQRLNDLRRWRPAAG